MDKTDKDYKNRMPLIVNTSIKNWDEFRKRVLYWFSQVETNYL